MSAAASFYFTATPCVPEVGDFYGFASISQAVVSSTRYSARRSFIRTLARMLDLEPRMVLDVFEIDAAPIALFPMTADRY
jgi:hypothetical protein